MIDLPHLLSFSGLYDTQQLLFISANTLIKAVETWNNSELGKYEHEHSENCIQE
jgi:hypothetical protein